MPHRYKLSWIKGESTQTGLLQSVSASHARMTRTEQIRETVKNVPVLLLASCLVAATFLWLGAGTPAMPALLGWCAIVSPVVVAGAVILFKTRAGSDTDTDAPWLRRNGICIYAALHGVLWGCGAMILLPALDGAPMMASLAIMETAAFIAATALAAIPSAAILFLALSLPGVGVALSNTSAVVDNVPLWAPVIVHAGAIAFVLSRQYRDFIRASLRRAKLWENREIMGFLREVEDDSSHWLWQLDREGHLEGVTQDLATAFGAPMEVLEQYDFASLMAQLCAEGDAAVDELRTAIFEKQRFQGIELAVTKDGEHHWWRLAGRPYFGEEAEFAGYIGIVSDITAEKNAACEITRLAHVDALTGVLNRLKFTDELNQCITELERDGRPFTLMFFDLDRFKLINDKHGHPVGDRILAQAAKRILTCVGDTGVTARLGGDEFAIILPNKNDTVFSAKLATQLIASVQAPYSIDGQILRVGLSIGVALAPQHGTRPDQILRNADLALYRAKQDGRGVFRFFETQMDSDQRERRILEQEMGEALTENEFFLRYQPLISSKTGRVVAMEALIRWNHPIRGEISPGEFIPIAEQSSLICEIGKWTLLEACRTAVNWPDDVMVSVNISANHFMHTDITSEVASVIEKTGIPASKLEIEITESLLIESSQDVLEKLRKLQETGVHIVMDDFGTGYSSLSYLLKFPFDKIKIDRSFVLASSEEDGAKAILRMISDLGKALKVRITAEGVETEEQVTFLSNIGCDELQGYHFAKPLMVQDVALFILSRFQEDVQAKHSGLSAKVRASG